MENPIHHEGSVESVDGEHIRVRIVQQSACAACKVAAHCAASEKKEKVVDVYHHTGKALKVGDAVVVSTSNRSAGKALLLAFGLPLVVVLGMLFGLQAAGMDEGLSAVVAIASLPPYYLGLWLFRHRIERDITFTID